VSDADPITGLVLAIAGHEWLSRTLAAATLVIELGFVTALFSRIARALFVPAAFLMLIGIRVLMGPTFGGFLVVNVFCVPWTTLLGWATSPARVRARTAAPVTTTDVTTTL
jgi:hypothetical protein